MENVEISKENSNGTVQPGGNFLENSNTFPGITFLPFLPKRPKFSVPFVWITTASSREKAKNLPVFCKWYNSIPFLFSVPKKYQHHLTEIFHRNFRKNGKRSKFGENGKRKRKTDKVVKFSPVNEKHLLILISLFQDYALSINKCSSTIKRYPGFLNFYYQYEKSQKWTHWFNRHTTIS